MGMTTEIPEGYEPEEVSTAKDIVLVVLEDYLDSEEGDLIEISDRIVEALIEAGVYIPEELESPYETETQ